MTNFYALTQPARLPRRDQRRGNAALRLTISAFGRA
jgi:hypothetical protein